MIGAYSIIQVALFLVVILGIVGVVLVIARQMGVQIPQYIVTIFWIILAVIVGVIAIKFLASLL